jgi:hypothetical protein
MTLSLMTVNPELVIEGVEVENLQFDEFEKLLKLQSVKSNSASRYSYALKLMESGHFLTDWS